MRTSLLSFAAAVAFATAAACGAGVAGGAPVTVVVESTDPPQTVFSGPVDTQPHLVDGGDGSGPHPCAGPPGTSPAPTATGALDDAMRGAGIPWRGNWDPSFEDFFVDRIGPFASAAPDDYWTLTVDGRFTAGGCLTPLAAGDTVRFSYGPLFGAGPDGAGEAAGTPTAGSSPGRPEGAAGGGTTRHGPSERLARIARRATAFLTGAQGVGADWAALALALRGRRYPRGAARALLARLRRLPGGRPIGEDVDFTALAVWSLAMRGRYAAARRAAMLVRSAQSADGGFPAVAGGESNAQSTGVALVALRVAGLGPRPTSAPGGPTPLDYLASLARPDGSIAYSPESRITPVWTTAQALLGLTRRARLLALGTAGRGG